MVVGITDQDSADQIARLPGAFGTSTLALMLSEKRAMHAVAIEGVMPSAKAVADGTYPYSKPLFMVTRGAPAGALARFVDFVRSAEGRRILTDTGHVLVGVKSSGKAFAR
jgi:phosphate transport system substrate-binding protein